MRTPFYDCHVKHGGKIVDFFGWDLPIQFSGIIKEHNCVREKVGLFDVSHMGEFIIEGEGAVDFADFAVTNNVGKLVDGQALYTTMCRENGTVVDDLLVYRINDNKILMVVNAANINKDFDHVSSLKRPDGLKLTNVSSEYAQLAIQGPKAANVVDRLIKEDVDSIGFFHFIETEFAGVPAIVSRTGYTGEDGFEIYFTELSSAEKVWDAIMESGKDFEIEPIGLGARDTLRFEGGLMLYGNDLDDTITPLNARLNWAVDFETEFCGKDALLKQKEEGIDKRLCGLKLIDKGIARHGYEVYNQDDEKIGIVTSGTKAPTVGAAFALAYVKHPLWKKDNELVVKIRNKDVKCVTVKYPFYKKPSLTKVNEK